MKIKKYEDAICSLCIDNITLDSYMIAYDIPVLELARYAKDNNMKSEVVKKICSHARLYSLMEKKLDVNEYLSTNLVFVDNKAVQPTEENVRECVEFLNMSGLYVCEYNVKKYVCKSLRGEVDLKKSLQENEKRNKQIKKLLKKYQQMSNC